MLSVSTLTVTEETIEKSRFITYSNHVESEEEAKEFIALIRSEHSLATHVCYGYIADKVGNLQRFSDDGEPSGTAGLPILDVIKKNQLFETCICVVRYFGGIKLGAGGLVRAYSGGAAANVLKAEKRDWLLCRMLSLTVGYGEIDAVQKFLSSHPSDLKGTEYLDKVVYQVAVKSTQVDSFVNELVDFLNGRVEISKKEEYFYPFPLAFEK